jgi:Predicted transcriptional regulators
METTGDRIRLWRRRRGMSQQTLAGLSGVSQAYVSQVERGLKTVERRSTLARLAAALNVSVAELTGTTDTADPVREEANRFVPAIREALLMRESGDRLDEQVAPGEVASAMLAEARVNTQLPWRRCHGCCVSLPAQISLICAESPCSY